MAQKRPSCVRCRLIKWQGTEGGMDQRKAQHTGFREVLAYITPHRNMLVAIVILLLLGSLLSLAGPWLAGKLTASLLAGSAAAVSPLQLLVLWFALMSVRAVLDFFTQYHIGYTGEHMTMGLRNRLYEHMQALPLAYHHLNRRGDTLSILYADAQVISAFVTDTLVHLLPALLTFVGAGLALGWLNPSIAVLALVFLPLYFLGMKIVGRYLRPLSRAWVDANAEMYTVLEENLRLLPVIKAFTREAQEQRHFEQVNSHLLETSRRQLQIQSALSPASSLLGSAALVVVIAVGATLIETDRLAAADLVTILLYAMLMMSPLATLANTYGRVQTVRGASERIITFLNHQPEPSDSGQLILTNIKGDIRLEGVAFSYPGREPLFSNLDLSIAAGETIALTGRNGAGKSTLAHLLMRFAQPSQGRILFDGIDIASATLSSVRACVGLVAQRVLLVNGSVADNIAYGCVGATRGALEKAARLACAHDFIAALPQGYDTVIGDEGIRLSGGQRQRLSLARTLLRDPPILILDEATAMFDPAGELAFIADCSDLLAHKTVILITHRPASLALADRVLCIEDGVVAERAPPAI